MSLQQVILASSWKPIVAGGVDFNGSTDYLVRSGTLTGQADSKTGIFSALLRIDGGDGTNRLFFNGTSSSVIMIEAFMDSANKVNVLGRSTSGPFSDRIFMTSSNAYTAGTLWHHVLAAWDVGSGLASMYIDGVSDLAASPTISNVAISYGSIDTWYAGGEAGSTFFNGCLAEVYFAPGQWLDITSSTNRQKFRTLTGVPNSLGSTGATPTGVAPLCYLTMSVGDAVSAFASNAAGTGAFTVAGSPVTASSSPSG